MPAHVVVIGAGVAGTAAAWAAVRAGARVTVVHDRAGASALYSGALDLLPWDRHEEPERRAELEDVLLGEPLLQTFAEALGVFRLGRSLLATREGVVRSALGSDPALLELGALAGKRIAVLDVERDDWDAALIAKSLSASSFAERTGTSFVPVHVRMLRTGYERRIAAYDFASFHDAPARLAVLAEALRAERGVAEAWLSGPWLGLDPSSVRELRQDLAMPIGETTSKLGGVAGARFERARDRLLQKIGARARTARVTGVSARGEQWLVALEPGDPKEPAELEASGVVLATGGVGAGGIRLTSDPENGRRGFELGYSAPVELALDGELLTGFGSLLGPSLEGKSFGALERVGIAVASPGNLVAIGPEAGRVLAAGDCVAGRPRTVLGAVQDGLHAGSAVARD
jgi:anaerobic glycerol-3-phosphate dehydrogenase